MAAELDALRAENERLTLADRQWADHVKRLAEENERLRALLRHMLETDDAVQMAWSVKITEALELGRADHGQAAQAAPRSAADS